MGGEFTGSVRLVGAVVQGSASAQFAEASEAQAVPACFGKFHRVSKQHWGVVVAAGDRNFASRRPGLVVPDRGPDLEGRFDVRRRVGQPAGGSSTQPPR